MPSINLLDNLGLDLSITNGDSGSTLSKYLIGDLKFVFDVATFRNNQSIAVSQVPREVLPLTLTSRLTGSFGLGGVDSLTVSEGLSASIDVVRGEDVRDLLGQFDQSPATLPVYLAFDTSASVSVAASETVNEFTFGMGAGGEIDVTNYRPCDPATTLVEATRDAITNFTLPVRLEDMEAMSAGTVFQVEGKGSLTFSAAAGYEFLNNALATIKTPIIKSPTINATGSADLQFSVEVFGGFRITVLKVAENLVRLAVSRSRGRKFAVDLSVNAGITLKAVGSDLLRTVLGQISTDTQQIEKLEALPSETRSSIEEEIKSALENSFAAGVSAELSNREEKETLFLYELDLRQLQGDKSKAAVVSALRGKYSQIAALASVPGSGIAEKQAIYTQSRKTARSLTIHLLNFFQFSDLSSLILNGTVQFSPDSGALIITDTATANQIKATTGSLHPDAKKLRALLFTSSVITAAYQGSKALVGAPVLSFRFEFFVAHSATKPDELRHELTTLAAINSIKQSEMNSVLSAGKSNYGATSLIVGIQLDAASSERLFLTNGNAFPQGYYETMGRNAMTTLLQGDIDATAKARLAQLTDLARWRRISDILSTGGNAGFDTAFGNLSPPIRADILGDHEVISWWAGAMSSFGATLQQIQTLVKSEGGFNPGSDQFKKLEKDFERKAADVVSTMKDRFDLPWGLLAIYSMLLPDVKVDVNFTCSLLTLGGASTPLATGGAA